MASQLEITNGHAARMRFSRFKQHMEGTTTTPRTPRVKKPKPEKGESKKRALDEPAEGRGKQLCGGNSDVAVKPEPLLQENLTLGATVKTEPTSLPYSLMTVAPSDLTMTGTQEPAPVLTGPQPPIGGPWPVIKLENNDERALDDVVVKMEPPSDK